MHSGSFHTRKGCKVYFLYFMLHRHVDFIIIIRVESFIFLAFTFMIININNCFQGISDCFRYCIVRKM